MFISVHSLGIGRSLSKAISFTIIVSRVSILEAVIMALIMGEFMVKFMFISIHSLRIGRSLSKAISFTIIVSRVSILEAVIMALIVSEFMVKFMLITVNSFRCRISSDVNCHQRKKKNLKLHD